jgi:hypothetical protein
LIKDHVAVIVFNNKEAEKLAADIKEKISCAEFSSMAGQRVYDGLSQYLVRPKQPGRVHGVSSYQGWKYAWPRHIDMYRKRKSTKTDTSVDMEKIKEQSKQELVAEMRMKNMQMQRWYGVVYRMDLPGPTTSVGTRTDYSVGPWEYPACATRHLLAWSTRTTEEKYSVRKLYMSCTVWKTPRRTRLVLSPYSDL